MATTFIGNQVNSTRVNGSLDETGDLCIYRYRDGRNAPATVRLEIKGTFVGTLDLMMCEPGSTTGYVADQFTAAESIVVTPGGDVDLVVKFSAYTSGTATVNLYAGHKSG